MQSHTPASKVRARAPVRQSACIRAFMRACVYANKYRRETFICASIYNKIIINVSYIVCVGKSVHKLSH